MRGRTSAAARQMRGRAAAAASHTAVMSRDAAAARRSRAGGHPRRDAARYPAAVTSVTGHSARANRNSSSHPVTLTILRISHRLMVSLSQDMTVMTAPLG